MTRYISGRLLQAVSLVLIVSVICFVLLRLTTDPIAMYNVTQMTGEDIARIRQELGLDQPIYVQYLAWLERAVRLDWGFSFASHRPVVEIIGERLPRSMVLAGAAEVVVIVVAMAMAILAALRPYSLLDNLLTTLTFVFFSMPIFWLGLALMYIFAVYFKRWGLPYLPTGGDIWDYGNPVQWGPASDPTCHLPGLGLRGHRGPLSALHHARCHQSGLRAHSARQRAQRADDPVTPRAEKRVHSLW